MSGAAESPDPSTTHLHLGHAWRRRGRPAQAAEHFRAALALDPGSAAAHGGLGEALLALGQSAEARECFRRAGALAPADYTFAQRLAMLDAVLEHGVRTTGDAAPGAPPPSGNGDGKLDLTGQHGLRCHRSGWGYALAALASLSREGGIRFDGFLEDAFAWRHWMDGIRPMAVLDRLRAAGTFDVLATSEERGQTPYLRPWVGVLHNPPEMPAWFHARESPQAIFARDVWKRSLPACRGLFTLSDHLARYVREATGLPVSVLVHPTEIPPVRFDLERFLANPDRQVIQVGWWLRDLNAIRRLPLPRGNPLGYRKVRLVPDFFPGADGYLRSLMAKQLEHDRLPVRADHDANTHELQHVPDGRYDELLAENVVFLQLLDASANNTVIECIARTTPLIVNPLPAVVEYLGADYPLYYRTLGEAAEKALDVSLLAAAHHHLARCPTRALLSAGAFRDRFVASEVYRAL